MENSKLFEIISSCSPKELKEISKWLQSPIHNQRKDIIDLYNFLLENPQPQPSKASAWEAIAPRQPFDDGKLRQVMFFLTESIEDYLAFQELWSDRVEVDLARASIYRRRVLHKPCKQTLHAVRKFLEITPYRNAKQLRNEYYLELETYKFQVNLDRNQDNNLQTTSNALDSAFIAEKLRLSCLILAHQAVNVKVTYDYGLLSSIISYIQKNKLYSKPAIAAYYYAYSALTNREEDGHYEKLEEIILHNGDIFPSNELRELYLFALNYCIYWINKGSNAYLHKAFVLYKKGFEKEILLENGFVSRFSFFNAVGNAIKVGNFEWAEQFMTNFGSKLEESHRESTIHFNRSRLYFEKKQYKDAQKMLVHYEYDDMLLNIMAKTMLLKIYFETDAYNALESLLESMNVYLKRKESLDAHRQIGYKNMLKFMRQIIRLTGRAKREKLIEQIKTTNPLMERDWLLSCV